MPDVQDVPGARRPAARHSCAVGRMRVRVAVDALGGDREPAEIVAGAVAAATSDVQPIIYGPAGLDSHGLDHVVTSEIVEMDDKPGRRRSRQAGLVARPGRSRGRRRVRLTSSSRRGTPAPFSRPACSISVACTGSSVPGSPSSSLPNTGPSCSSTRARTLTPRPEHLLQFGHMGVDLRRGGPRYRAILASASSRSARSRRRATS